MRAGILFEGAESLFEDMSLNPWQVLMRLGMLDLIHRKVTEMDAYRASFSIGRSGTPFVAPRQVTGLITCTLSCLPLSQGRPLQSYRWFCCRRCSAAAGKSNASAT